LILPPHLSAHGFEQALKSFEAVVGREWVLATDEDRESYLDVYAPGDADAYAPSAAGAGFFDLYDHEAPRTGASRPRPSTSMSARCVS